LACGGDLVIWETVGIIVVLWIFFLGREVIGTVLYNSRHLAWTLERGEATQVPELDHERLTSLTAELGQLGFVLLGDLVTTHGPDPRWPPKGPVVTRTTGIGRIMACPSSGCYAVLVSGRAVSTTKKGKPAVPNVRTSPFRVAIVSLTEQDETFWSYGTTNREVDPFMLMMKQPRSLGRRLVGAAPASLLEVHFEERARIAECAQISWDSDATLEKWEAFEGRSLWHMQEVYERATISKVAWLLLTYRFGKHDCWFGALTGKLRA
jgi:hypothetical protein